jgi:hypothetical protein
LHCTPAETCNAQDSPSPCLSPGACTRRWDQRRKRHRKRRGLERSSR